MTIEQLRYFIAAAALDNFSKAADQEFTTQSTISKQIRNLENELGVQLFNRTNRHISLSDAGQVLYADAVSIVGKVNTLKAHAEQFSNENNERIRVFSLPFVSQYNLRIAIKKFLEYNPTITVEIFEVEEKELLKQLSMNYGDLFIMRDNLPIEGKNQQLLITTDELALFLPHDHPLALNKSVSLEMLANEQFAMMHDYTSVYQLCVNSCNAVGFTPKIYCTSRLESIFGTVSNGEAVALLMMKNTNTFMLKGISVVQIRPKIESRIVAIIPPMANNRSYIFQLIRSMVEYAI